jgi:predicted permease
MTILSVAINVIAPIFAIIGLAALVARRFDPDARTLSTLIIYLFSPFLVLDGMAHSQIQADELVQIMGAALLLAVIMAGVGYAMTRIFNFERRLASAFMMTIVLLNAGNYGLPLNEFAFGPEGLQRAMVFYVTTGLVANTFGVFLASRGAASMRDSFINIFKVPLVYCLIIGLLLNFTGTTMPMWIERFVARLGSAAVPAMLVLLGIQLNSALQRATLRERWKPILLAAGTRLIVGPVVALGIAAVLGLSGVTRSVVIVESSMSTAVISGVLAIQFDADADFVTGVILVTTLASVATLSVILLLLGVQ